MIKFVLIIGVLVVSILIGLYINSYLKTRCLIYLDLKDIIQNIKLEIGFLKTEKGIVLSKQICKNKNTQAFINGYVSNGNGYSNYLKDQENDEVNELLDSIGKNDIDGEIHNLELIDLKIVKKCKETEENFNRYGAFAIKMSIIIGTLIVIILI